MVSSTKIFCNYIFYYLIFNAFVASEAAVVSFSEHANGDGERISITLNEGVCYNMPAAWNDRASQLTTPSQMCLDVYENAGCSGKAKHFSAGYAMFVELKDTEINDFISSFRVSSRGKNGCAEF